MRTLLVDNYDSFTYNLFQLLAEVNDCEPTVVRNDEIAWSELRDLPCDNIVISPGPGTPRRRSDLGVCRDILAHAEVPILGVCLGHQAMCHACGGEIVRAPTPMHGRLSQIHHVGTGIFDGIPSPFVAVRYHSLIAAAPLPHGLTVTAWTDDRLVMAVQHDRRLHWGVQFHPESILTEFGKRLLQNFRDMTGRTDSRSARRAFVTATPWRTSGSSRAVGRPPGQPTHHHQYRVECRRLQRYADPATVFRAMFSHSPSAFWLDSSLRTPYTGRFSYMGDVSGPHSYRLSYTLPSGHTHQILSDGSIRQIDADIFGALQRLLSSTHIECQQTAFPFVGGYVGYLGYELKSLCGGARRHASPHPDAQLIFPGKFLCFDHDEKALYVVCLVSRGSTFDDAWFDQCAAVLQRPAVADATIPRDVDLRILGGRWRSPQSIYGRLIRACLEEIRAGESYEVCLTNRRYFAALRDPLHTYLILRRVNPAPYSAYLRFGDLHVLCSSPEGFLNIGTDRTVITKPIKGTRRRGATPPEDAQLREDLASSEKDRAENLMITDLLRNDLGSVCEIGSVHVPSLMAVESYQTVHQLVTTVQGTLSPRYDAVDCFRALFPGGSMTGAPKRRTMDIIDRLEGTARGIYSGAIGFFSLSGTAEFNILIRTIVSDPNRSVVGSGGAIVALSDPESEFAEIELKAAALLRAAAISETGAGARVARQLPMR